MTNKLHLIFKMLHSTSVKLTICFIVGIVCLVCQANGQSSDSVTLRVSTYNVHKLGYRDFTSRHIDCGHIVAGLQSSIVVLQDVVDSFDLRGLAQYASLLAAPVPFLNQTGNAFLYDSAKIVYIDETVVPIGGRFASQWRVVIRGTGDTLVVIGCQLSEGQDSLSTNSRYFEAQALRYHIHTIRLPNCIVAGTLNVDSSDDPAYLWFTQKFPAQDSILLGQSFDPIALSGNWHDDTVFARHHTTSTRIAVSMDSGRGGGMIDRHDFILLSKNLLDSAYVPNSYFVYFNYGKSFRDSIRTQDLSFIHLAWAQNASDHLPVVLDLVMRRNVSSVDSPASLPTKMDLSQRYSTDIDSFPIDNREDDQPFGVPPLPVTQSTSQP